MDAGLGFIFRSLGDDKSIWFSIIGTPKGVGVYTVILSHLGRPEFKVDEMGGKSFALYECIFFLAILSMLKTGILGTPI